MAPVAFGVNVTLKVHFPLDANVAPQAFEPEGVAVKSPLAAMLEIVSVPPELFVSVTVCGALVVPTACVPKLRLTGDSVTGIAPVPVTSTICGLPAPDVAIATLPLVDAVSLGVNVTDIVHFPDAASGPPQGVAPLPAAENVALPVTPLIVTVLALLFVTVMVLAALAMPMPVFAKLSVAGLKVNGAVGPPVPVPESATISGLRGPLVGSARLPLIEPLEVGAKVTVIVQLPPAPSDAPQLPPVME
jgi:hypothetical protein